MPDCPRCLHPLLTDPATGLLPARCPHCGASLDNDAPHHSSLASFLRPDVPASLSGKVMPASTASSTPSAASPGLQATPTTSDGALVQPPALITDAVPAAQSRDMADEDIDSSDAVTAHDPSGHAVSSVDTAALDLEATGHDASASDAVDDGDSAENGDLPVQEAGPSFILAPRKPAAPRVPMWQWSALALLTAALGIQMLIADRGRLAQDALWRPVLEHTCSLLRCTLPAWHQPQAYTMLARSVTPVSGAAGVLQVRATFRNDARWPQAWPSVALSLSDADGRIAGARVLQPRDYLQPAQLNATLAPGQSGQLTVQVREPATGVVAFAFEFR